MLKINNCMKGQNGQMTKIRKFKIKVLSKYNLYYIYKGGKESD